MDLSEDEEGEIIDAQLEKSWNQSFTGDPESTTPPLPFPGSTAFQPILPFARANSFKPADNATVPPPPFSVPPPDPNHKGGWINSFNSEDSSKHSFPPPGFKSGPHINPLINPPPTLSGPLNSNNLNTSLSAPHLPPFAANNSFRDDGSNLGTRRDSLDPFSEPDFRDPGFENDFPNTGSSFNPRGGFQGRGGDPEDNNQEKTNSDFNAILGNHGGQVTPSPRGGFRGIGDRGRGGGGVLERSNSSPEKMFWGDRGRGTPRGGGFGRGGGMNMNRGGGMTNERGGIHMNSSGGISNEQDAMNMNRGGGMNSDVARFERGRGDFNRGGGFDRGGGGFDRGGGGGFDRGGGGFNRGSGGFDRGGGGGFDRGGGGGFNRGGGGGVDRGGFSRGGGKFDRGRGGFSRGGFGGHTPDGGIGRGGMERGRRPWRGGGRGSW